ncbi:MAG TPA: hypothetical protein PKC24_00555 [Cyclobacteriaceae bacterium]|nr:hypothetical protein [Cyclobacteriaceae bacterium]
MRKILIAIGIAVAGIIIAQQAMAQKVDQEKMDRDLEVAGTVLGSMLSKSRGVMLGAGRSSSSYVEGYGVIINVPYLFTTSAFTVSRPAEVRRIIGNVQGIQEVEVEVQRANEALAATEAEVRSARRLVSDSTRIYSEERMLETIKTFLLDYADLIGQLKDSERIKVVSKSDFGVQWTFTESSSISRGPLSAEIKKADLNAYKAGKINRDEALRRILVTTSATESPTEQDLELLASIFNRLYRSDLSKTYWMDGRTFYERMTDYGVIFNMSVYSSQNMGKDKYYMPTIGARDLSQADRDKKVKELYPQFEKDLKDNVLEYGRMLRSLKDDEQLIFKVKITQCEACGIPSTLEVSVKASVLKEYNAGKLDKNSALAKINIKKGPNQ